jgi:hypothetical protein
MNLKAVAFLVALLAAVPAFAREAASGGNGAGDPATHDGADDKGGLTGSGSGSGPGAVDNGGGGSGSSGGSATDLRARRDLVRAAGASDADVYGHVEVRSRDGREKFTVEAEHLDAGAVIEVIVEDGAATLVSAGTATAGTTGEAELELDTGDGATLPAGASTVAGLAGRAVEVRDAAGGVLLTGTVPAVDASSGNAKASSKFEDDSTGASGKSEMKVQGRTGRQRFRLEAKGLPADAAAELWLDDGTGTFVQVASVATNGGGKAKFRLDTRKGDALPLGVTDLQELSGRAFEVRVDGVTAASGNLPTL